MLDQTLSEPPGEATHWTGRMMARALADVPAADGIDREDMRSEAVTLSHLLRRIRTQIVILDACRNNPFGEAASRGLGGARGLAPVAPPRGTFVMYSAATDQLARDRLSDEDAEPTSVFTRTLLRKLTVEGKPITDVAREVRDEVAALAKQVNHEQRPAQDETVMRRPVE